MKTTLLQTEHGIELVKTTFAATLAKQLQLTKVSAPIMLPKYSGLNDNLNGIEKPVTVAVKSKPNEQIEIVHSLAKWKRLRLKQFSIPEQHGIYTDMRALRPDEDLSEIHSVYVDQWDWEKHISKTDRTLNYLKETVRKIYKAIQLTELAVADKFKHIEAFLPEEITFIHAEELRRLYPKLSPKEREHKITEKHKAVFIIGIGGRLSNGEVHDLRAPDYDDWTTVSEKDFKGLNGDILVWNPILKRSFELSSMGIRVDKIALKKQLTLLDCEDRKTLPFHKQLLAEELPQSIGGGIGQSRLCMFLLRKAHIGEVQASVWTDRVLTETSAAGIELL